MLEGENYSMTWRGMRTVSLHTPSHEVSIHTSGIFKRRLTVESAKEIPTLVMAFAMWLVIRKQNNDSSAGA